MAIITDLTGANAVAVNSVGSVSTQITTDVGTSALFKHGSTLDSSAYGMPHMLQNDNNALLARGDRFGSTAIATVQPYISWMVEGATLNARQFTSFATTMAATQTAQGLTLNSANVNTLSTNYQLNTMRQVPLHMKGPLLMRLRARFTQWNVTNANAEFGYANVNTTLGSTANLNGVYWRFDSNGVMPVYAFNGAVVAVGTNVASLLATTSFYHWGVIKDDDAFVFTVQDSQTGSVLSRQTIQVPAGQAKAVLASHAQPYIRTFNSATAPTAGTQVIMSELTIGLLDLNLNMSQGTLHAGLGLGSDSLPTTGATSSNLANAAVAPTTVPTNTTATATSLDGAIRMAAPAGAVNDLALFSFTVPAPYSYKCKGVRVAVKNLGAAVATSATQVDLYLCVNASAVTLVGNLNRKYLGTQTFPIGAAVGSSASEGTIVVDLKDMELVTEPGRVMTLVARISTGTATASQVLEINYSNLGHFE